MKRNRKLKIEKLKLEKLKKIVKICLEE